MRNALMHSTNMKVSQPVLKTYLQIMVNLLEDPATLLLDPAAKQAVSGIKKVV